MTSLQSPVSRAVVQVLKIQSNHPSPQPPGGPSNDSTTVFQFISLQRAHLPRSSILQRSSTHLWSALSPQSIRTQLKQTNTGMHRHATTMDLLLSLSSATRPQFMPGSRCSFTTYFTSTRPQVLPSAHAARCRPWLVSFYNPELLLRLTMNRIPTALHQMPPSHETVRLPCKKSNSLQNTDKPSTPKRMKNHKRLCR